MSQLHPTPACICGNTRLAIMEDARGKVLLKCRACELSTDKVKDKFTALAQWRQLIVNARYETERICQTMMETER